jgi:hypothetical protein
MISKKFCRFSFKLNFQNFHLFTGANFNQYARYSIIIDGTHKFPHLVFKLMKLSIPLLFGSRNIKSRSHSFGVSASPSIWHLLSTCTAAADPFAKLN